MRFRRLNNELFVASPAKLNLFLELLGKRADGFHEIETVMMTVSLFDRLRFVPRPDTDQFELRVGVISRGPTKELDSIPTDDRNLVLRSLKLLQQKATDDGRRQLGGMEIHLQKWIPSSAGLGGASSNAAAALVAGNLLWELGYTLNQLSRLAAELGSDIPFFVDHSTALCSGRGELVDGIRLRTKPIEFVIVKPAVRLSTREVYQHVELPTGDTSCACPTTRRVAPLVEALARGSISQVAKQLWNRLEFAARRMTDELQEIRRQFDTLPSLGHQLSGSGSSYFGIFGSRAVASSSARRLRARFPDARVFHVQSFQKVSMQRTPLNRDRVVA